MRLVFGVLSLLVVLVVVGTLAKKQLHAVGAVSAVDAAGAAAASSDPGVAARSRGIQQKARDDTVRALQQGADRNARAEP